MVVEPVYQQHFEKIRVKVPDQLNPGKSAADDNYFFQWVWNLDKGKDKKG
jgi:hypothetical protein